MRPLPVRRPPLRQLLQRRLLRRRLLLRLLPRLLLRVRASVCLSMAKTQQTKTLSYEVCIAETVIVGEVPALYANMNNGE